MTLLLELPSVQVPMLIVTVSTVGGLAPSLTVSENDALVLLPVSGAVKVGCAAFASLSVTVGPLTWVHV